MYLILDLLCCSWSLLIKSLLPFAVVLDLFLVAC
jgi:hypothetical protein